jgi:hypothetical protein
MGFVEIVMRRWNGSSCENFHRGCSHKGGTFKSMLRITRYVKSMIFIPESHSVRILLHTNRSSLPFVLPSSRLFPLKYITIKHMLGTSPFPCQLQASLYPASFCVARS